jgi:DNA polymerase I-like protein with 3'-5' exonuclease and polymerase domains
MRMTVDQYATKVYNDYFTLVPFVRPTSKGIRALCNSKGFMRSVGGRMHRLNPKKDDYVMPNYICQGGGADILKAGLVSADKKGIFDYIKLHLTVHDENITSCQPNKASVEAQEEFERCMCDAIKLKVPIRVDKEAGPNWAACTNEGWEGWREKYGNKHQG